MTFTKTMRIIFFLMISMGLLTCHIQMGEAARKKKKERIQILRLFDFETDVDGWRIPDWALPKEDNAALDIKRSKKKASSGRNALEFACKFSNKIWTGAYMEIERKEGEYFDFTGKNHLMADIFISKNAPPKLQGEFILTVGEEWEWVEMRKSIKLIPGRWNTVRVDITPDSIDWKVRFTEEIQSDVRKIGLRVSSDSVGYKGSIYVDNIRLGSRAK